MKRVFSVDGMAVLNCEVWGYHGDSKIPVCWDVTTCKTVKRWRRFEGTSTSVFTVEQVYLKQTAALTATLVLLTMYQAIHCHIQKTTVLLLYWILRTQTGCEGVNS